MHENLWIPVTRSSLTHGKLVRWRNTLDRIPKLPLSVRRIIEMSTEEEIDPKELAEVASADPVLVSKILIMVNSSYYSLQHKIDNLRLAIVLLGFNEVRKIAIKTGLSRLFNEPSVIPLYDIKHLWIHSYLVSVVAETFADDDPLCAGVLVTLGMLHDIGKLALHAIGVGMKEKNGTWPTKDEIGQCRHILQKEECIFGINHAVIGGLLAEKWDMSDRISAITECHHYPTFFGVNMIPPKYQEDVTIIALSDRIVAKLSGDDRYMSEPHDIYFEIVDRRPPLDNLISDDLRSRYVHAMKFVKDLI